MPSFLRTLILAAIFIGITLLGLATFAMAKTVHHRHHHVTHHHHHVTHHASRGNSQLRSAQTHLAHLGFYTGKADGKMGPKTKIALKNFQRKHHLPVTGTLTARTYNAILEADRRPSNGMGGMLESNTIPPQPDFYEKNPDYYGHVHQDFSNPIQQGEPQKIPTRYGDLQLAKSGDNNYVLNLNGQPVVTAQDQPSVIGVSQTYDLGTEDAIVVSTYRSQSTVCSYQTYLMTLNSTGNHVQEVGNCTRGYQANAKDGSLWIIFPETDDARAVGATFRYENGDLEKL